MAEVPPKGIEIELNEQVAEGVYVNLGLINYSTSEFVFDFATMMPGMPKARIKSRVIMTPEHAKRLMRNLQENIARYESAMGKIELPAPSEARPAGPKMGEA